MKETKEILFNDIDFSFRPHPVTGDVTKLTNVDAVKTSVKNLILTSFGERFYQYTLGSRVYDVLFETVSSLYESVLAEEIRNVIDNYEPRAIINTIKVNENADSNGYNVTIEFNVLNDFTPQTVDLFIKRLR